MAKKKDQKRTPLEQQQPYDNALKSLLEGQEAQILPQFLPGAVYQETCDIEVIRPILRTDRVYKVWYKGVLHILHLEFQTSADADMAKRLLEYHAYLYAKYGIPVISIIIYLFRTKVAVSPLEEISDGEVILRFHFRVFPLWVLEAARYMEDHIIAMYALLPAMAGANAHVLEQAIAEMIEYYKNDEITLARDLRWMGIMLRRTDCVLEEEKRMIQERLSMYDDLMENDPEMKRLRAKYAAEGLAEGLAEGEAKGLAKGEAKGLAKGEAKGLSEGLAKGEAKGLSEGLAKGQAEGKMKALRTTILTFVKVRFPALRKQTRQSISQITDADELQEVFEQLVSASDEVAVREILATLEPEA
jgi:flagellar biosynthesis/type III secretory pathway protein FliH